MLDRIFSSAHTLAMTNADKLTSVRLVFAPVFFVLFSLQYWFPAAEVWNRYLVPLLWVLFVVAELTDLFDGMVARASGEVSDFGKLFDPFADTLARLTYFFCFVLYGFLPAFLFVIILYREFGMLFLRMQFMRRGVAMGARWSGKIKAVVYMLAGAFALLQASFERLLVGHGWIMPIHYIALAVFGLSVILSVYSFLEYIRIYYRKP